MIRSPIIRAACALLAAVPQSGVNAVSLRAEDDRTRAALARSAVEACGDLFPAGAIWLDMQGGVLPLTVLRQAERQVGIAASGDVDLDRRTRAIQRRLQNRGRALFILGEPQDDDLARWVVNTLIPRAPRPCC